MPVEVGDSSWGSVCVPAGHVYGASGGSGRGSGSCISGRLPTSVSPRASTNDCSQVLQMPQANTEFPNTNIENVTERSRLEMHDWNLVSKTTQRMKSCLKDRTTPYTPHTAGILSQRQHDIWNLVRKRQHNTAYTPHNSWNLVSKTTQHCICTTQQLESCLKDHTVPGISSEKDHTTVGILSERPHNTAYTKQASTEVCRAGMLSLIGHGAYGLILPPLAA